MNITGQARALTVLMLVSALTAGACDQFAQVEVYNDTDSGVSVGVNGRAPEITVPPGGRDYTGPNVNKKLKSLTFASVDDPGATVRIEFDTYRDDIVVYISGPPLAVTVTHQKHPSATRTPTP